MTALATLRPGSTFRLAWPAHWYMPTEYQRVELLRLTEAAATTSAGIMAPTTDVELISGPTVQVNGEPERHAPAAPTGDPLLDAIGRYNSRGCTMGQLDRDIVMTRERRKELKAAVKAGRVAKHGRAKGVRYFLTATAIPAAEE